MIPERVSPRATTYSKQPGWSGQGGRASKGSPGSSVGGTYGVDEGVAATGVGEGGNGVGAAVGVGTTVGAADAVGAGAVGSELGGALDANVGSAEATATGPSVAATGSWRPPRAPTKAMANTAQAATKTADATIAGVSVGRSGAAFGSSTPPPRRVSLAADSSTFSDWPRASGEC